MPKSILKRALINASGNRFVQLMLERHVQVSQYLMGIGSGGAVRSSGEQALFRILKQAVEPPYCIFDVGSNKGQFLQLGIDNLPTDDFRIHCFEPAHHPFKALVGSFHADERIKLNNFGLGRHVGEATLYYDEYDSGLASLTKRKLEHLNIQFSRSEKVVILTLDKYCEDHAIDHIHLLKLDIEGHELDALNGATRMFANRSIDIVGFEFGGCNIDTRTFFRDFWYFFRKANFRLFRVTPSGYLHPLAAYNEICEQFRTVNFIALANANHGLGVLS
jgi:FkbM family methyltransferase